MSRTVLFRGELTDYLLERLGEVVLVGDGKAPDEGGWDDDPNDPESSFVPYAVVSPQNAPEASGSLGDSNTEWRLPYSYTVFAISREHVEFYADRVRQACVDLARTVVVLGDSKWKIQQCRVNSIGGVSRSDVVEPSEYAQTDVVVLYISKEI